MAEKYVHTIVCVDDEEGILNSFRRLLKNLDVTVKLFNRGKDALEYIRSNHVSLIISDQRMPGIQGVELLQQSRELSPDTVRILLTGYTDIDASIDAINSGAIKYYLSKPWDDEFLLSRIKESLELHRATVENKRLNNLLNIQNTKLKIFNKTLEQKVAEQTSEIRRQHEELSTSFMNTIKSFSTIIEMRFKDVGSHSQRVATLTSKMCKSLELNGKDYQDIVIASYLHDIGKVSLPDKIIQKDHRDLQKTEIEAYKNHPVLGQTCLYGIQNFEEIAIIIRHHHENYNGSGFPDNLHEQNIPLGSRVIRLADAFDKFAFKQGYPSTKILKEAAANLVEHSRSNYDPELVKKFIEHDLAQSFIVPESPDTITVRPYELEPRMILSSDIHTRSGMFLLPKGAKLSSGMIKRIIKIDSIDPIRDGVSVNKQQKKHEGKDAELQTIIG